MPQPYQPLRRAFQPFVLAVCSLASGCLAPLPVGEDGDEREGRLDGAVCSADDECASKLCTHSHLCAHSACDCPGNACDPMGEASRDCSDGWVCVYYESIFESIGEAFLVEHDMNGGNCQALCEGGCPEHYSCHDGHFCTPDPYWPNPVPSLRWSGAVSGQLEGREQMREVDVEAGRPVTLEASASSPVGAAITSYQWMLVSNSERSELSGTRAEVSAEAGSFLRAELMVGDDESHYSPISVTFRACSGTGTACGYQGSGCCRSCESASNTCL
jgi:hypothetical protein